MEILILGGTAFLGRHLVDAARAAGHNVATFTRGRTNPDIHANDGVETLRGDRDGDLGALEGRKWDAVIDTSGYFPRVVRASAELLRDSCAHYTFVSTVSVYPEERTFDSGEDVPPATIEDPTIEQITAESYGPLKALCEDVVTEVFGARALNVRPGLIVGPFDPTGRFTYWPRRAARGGEMLAPGDGSALVQVIDARDLAEWIVRAADAGANGTFNAVTDPIPMREVVDACVSVAGSGARVTWVDDEFLLEHDVGPWMELPLWVGGEDMRTPNERAKRVGLTFRPIDVVARDTLEWDAGRDVKYPAGLDPEKERQVLEAWRARA